MSYNETTIYSFQVKETVTEQVVEEVQAVTETKPKAPSAPKNLEVQEATESGVTIQWQTPDEDGGAPIKQFTVSVKEEGKKKYKQVGTVDATVTEFKILELKEDKTYEVRVQAVNEVGTSEKAAELKEPFKVPTRTVSCDPYKPWYSVLSIYRGLFSPENPQKHHICRGLVSQVTHKGHHISRLYGRDMGRLLRLQSHTKSLLFSCCKHLVILGRDIPRVYTTVPSI